MPWSHSIPFLLANNQYYDSLLPRLLVWLTSKGRPPVVIDVGANIGDTATLITDRADVRVLCLEPDPVYFDFLVRNTRDLKNVSPVRAAVSDRDEQVVAPQLRKQSGTAFMDEHGGVTLDSLLETHAEFKGVTVLKVDTDGYDFKVLRGARRTLAAKRPIVYFEHSPEHYVKVGKDDPLGVFPFLTESGYDKCYVYDSEGYLLASLSAREGPLFESLIHYAQVRGRYYDILAFPASEQELAEEFLRAERAFFPLSERDYLK